MMLILDSDISSTFAKISRLELLAKLFSKYDLAITPLIKEELRVPLEHGYSFPEKIFQVCKTIVPTEQEHGQYITLLQQTNKLGKGELEATAICISRAYPFASNDRRALEFARQKGITIFSLPMILRALWVSGCATQEEVQQIILNIELEDNTRLKDIDQIFEEE